MARTIFFISDGTAITGETLGHSLLAQFSGVEFSQMRIPFVGDKSAALEAVAKVNLAGRQDKAMPIVINTIVDKELSAIIHSSKAVILDLLVK